MTPGARAATPMSSRRVLLGFLVLLLAFVGVFGWLYFRLVHFERLVRHCAFTQCLGQLGIEVRSPAFRDDVPRALPARGAPVPSPVRQCVEDIHHTQDSGKQGNVVTFEAIGVSGTVRSLMMVTNDWAYVVEQTQLAAPPVANRCGKISFLMKK